MLRVAINGFGRIGRSAFKIAIDFHKNDCEIVAVNDLTSPDVLAYLLKYDSSYSRWDHQISSDDKNLIVDGKSFPVFSQNDPSLLPWRDLAVDVVIESTGRFRDAEGASSHLKAGAKKVVISAPAKGEIPVYLLGVNAASYKGEAIIDNSSCTTNCVAPVAAVIHSKFGVLKAAMTTIHGYTTEQNLQDGPPPGLHSSEWRRGRAAAENIVPASTGAAIATTKVIPELEGIFDGTALRVPVAVGSISDFTFLVSKKVTIDEINQAFREATQNPIYKGVLAVTNEALVSKDIIGRPESAIVDLTLTQVIAGDLVKVFAWYDNEYGYSHRLVEQVINVGKSNVA